jgi:hypothetical protein
MLKAGQEVGLVRKDIDVEFIASVLIAVIEGTMIQSRLAPEDVRVDETIEPLSRLIADWMTP